MFKMKTATVDPKTKKKMSGSGVDATELGLLDGLPITMTSDKIDDLIAKANDTSESLKEKVREEQKQLLGYISGLGSCGC